MGQVWLLNLLWLIWIFQGIKVTCKQIICKETLLLETAVSLLQILSFLFSSTYLVPFYWLKYVQVYPLKGKEVGTEEYIITVIEIVSWSQSVDHLYKKGQSGISCELHTASMGKKTYALQVEKYTHFDLYGKYLSLRDISVRCSSLEQIMPV